MERKFKKKVKTGYRLFLCLMPEKNIRDQARDIQRSLTKYSYKLGFVNIEQLHLTVKFLGNNVSPKTTERMIEELHKFSHTLPKIRTKTEEIEFGFASQTVAKTLYLNVEENDDLLDLVDKVDAIVKRISGTDVIKKKERKKFTSHITVARVKHDISRSHVKGIRSIIENLTFEPQKFETDYLYVIKSDLTKKGPIYSIYTKIPLALKTKDLS